MYNIEIENTNHLTIHKLVTTSSMVY